MYSGSVHGCVCVVWVVWQVIGAWLRPGCHPNSAFCSRVESHPFTLNQHTTPHLDRSGTSSRLKAQFHIPTVTANRTVIKLEVTGMTCINYTKNGRAQRYSGRAQRYSAVPFQIETWAIFLKYRAANCTAVQSVLCFGVTSTMLCTCVCMHLHVEDGGREADPGSGEVSTALPAIPQVFP